MGCILESWSVFEKVEKFMFIHEFGAKVQYSILCIMTKDVCGDVSILPLELMSFIFNIFYHYTTPLLLPRLITHQVTLCRCRGEG